MEQLNLGKAKLIYNDEDEIPSLIVTGIIDLRDSSFFIMPYINQIHESVCNCKKPEIIINLSELEYMNSNGIYSFISWVINIEQLSEENRYKIRFIYNPSYTWQKSTIQAIERLLPQNVCIEEYKNA